MWSDHVRVNGTCVTVILLLTNGNPVDSYSQISQTISAGNQLIDSQVAIISFSMNSGELLYSV